MAKVSDADKVFKLENYKALKKEISVVPKRSYQITFATSCDLNYLAQAHVLAKSVKEMYPESHFTLGLNESNQEIKSLIYAETKVFDQILIGTELHRKFDELSYKYGIVELCCSVKPELLLKCFETDSEIVVYLDPDTFLTSALDEVEKLLGENHVQAVFTPHLKKLGNLEMEVSAMKHGILNLGFLALKNDLETINFLKWWNERLETLCIRDNSRGIFTDQTWAALGSGVLESRILRDPGYNFATWNLADHQLSVINGKFLIDGHQLVFAHFSSYLSGGIENFIEKYKVEATEVYYQLLSTYSTKVKQSAELLAVPISFKRDKISYQSNHRNLPSMASAKIYLVDYLGSHNPSLLKLLMRQKARLRKFFG